ncbi:MAG: hypothetical protein HYX92_21340 [Chloroflexi bacterium]|nr:hypothetical protein [Chloroflexota bacterium]
MAKTILKGMLPLLFGLALAGLVGEGVLRVAFQIQKPIWAPSPDSRRELVPGFYESKGSWEVRINSKGLRDYEYPLEKAQGKFRIAVLGDSVSFGSGVNLEDTYAKVLERTLNRGANRYEVINFSVPAADTPEELAALKGKVPSYKPDLVVLGYMLNDTKPTLDAAPGANPSGGVRQHLRVFARFLNANSYLFAFSWERLERIMWKSSVLRVLNDRAQYYETEDAYTKWIVTAYTEEPDSAWTRVKAGIREMKDLSGAKSAPLFLVILPFSNSVYDSDPDLKPQDLVSRFALEENIPYLDLTPRLRENASEALFLPNDMAHLTSRGHEIAAEAIFNELKARGLVPSAPK